MRHQTGKQEHCEIFVSSNEVLLKEKIQYVTTVFTEINEYPKHLVDNIVRQGRQDKGRSNEINPDDRETH